MTANLNPIFTLTPVIGSGVVSSANTNRDGTGDLVDIITGGANGTRITRITIQAVVTTTAGMIRLYIYDGSTTVLWKEIAVTAISVSASVIAFAYALEYLGDRALVLPANYVLRASTHNAEAFRVIAEGGDF